MGLVSGWSLANHSNSESFLVVHTSLSQDGCYREGFWEVDGHAVSPSSSILGQGTKILHAWWHGQRKKKVIIKNYISVQFSHSVVSDSLWPMNRSTPGLPVHHHLPEFTQTHIHRVGDATQPSHPLSSPSPPALNPSQHQNLFQWVNSSHEVAKVLEFQL